MLQGKAWKPKTKEKRSGKKKLITAKPLGMKPYASSLKVAPAVPNKNITRRMVFLHREPPRTLFKDDEVTRSLSRSMNVLVAFFFYLFIK